jgi:TonB-dependent receptor
MTPKQKNWSRNLLCTALMAGCWFALLSTVRIHAATNNAASSTAASNTTTAIIQGTVLDAGGGAVPGAQLTLEPIHIAVISDSQGAYRIPDVPAGKYKLAVSYIGFAPLISDVEVTSGQTLHLDLTINIANSKQSVQVYATLQNEEAESINETRTADNVLDVMPASVITSLPNANVADAIGRFSGVSLFRDEGEGEYIQVRGTEPRLTNVTVDGITVPAPEPIIRQVRLDVIPASMVGSIQLSKTLLANMDGNGIGGSVNLVTKQADERPTLDLYGDGGRTPVLNGRGTYDFGGTAGKRFGASKRFGLLGNAGFDWNGRGIDNFQPTIDPYSTFATPFYDNNTIREYRYTRTRYGFSGSADYRLDEHTTFYAHGFYSNLKDAGDKWYYEPQSQSLSGTPADAANLPPATESSPNPKFYTSLKTPDASIGTLILGGRTVHQDSLFFYQISASRSYETNSAGNPKADFSWTGPTTFCNYIPSQQTDVYRPHFGNCDDTNTSPLLSAANWKFKDITIPGGVNTDLTLTAQTSYAKSYRWWGHFGNFEAGFKFSNMHQTQDSTESVYDSFGSAAPSMTQLLDNFVNTDYFDGTYFGGHFGQVSNFTSAQNYTLANLKGDLDGQATAADVYPNLFHTVEQVTAGYVMNSIDFGKLHVNTGLRIEATRDLTFGYNLTFYSDTNGDPANALCPNNPATPPSTISCYTFAGVNNNPAYVDVLPSVELRYGLAANSNLRAVVSRGVARPDPGQLVPYVEEDNTASPIAVTIGNPSLRPEHSNNYDLLYEKYLQPVGMLQAGFFFKQLQAPQVEVTLPGGQSLSNYPPGYFPTSIQTVLAQYPGDAITQFTNGQNAYIYGIELSLQQHFTYLPGVFKGLGLNANYIYSGSREKGLPLRTDHPSMIDQAPTNWNITPSYDTKRFSSHVALSYNGESINSYFYTSPTLVPGSDPSGLGPNGPNGDIWTYVHLQVDAQASYRLYKGITAVVSGLNLSNEVFGYYQGSTQFVNQREYYKPTYSGGLRYAFGKH